MAPSLTKTRTKTKDILLRRKKLLPIQDHPVIPITDLPYELRLLILSQSVLSPTPIPIGRTLSRLLLPSHLEQHAKSCHHPLFISRSLRQDLYRTYYAHNTFEFGFYYDRSGFFETAGAKLVRYVIVDALRALVSPKGVPSTIVEHLGRLQGLRWVGLRLRGNLGEVLGRYHDGLARFLRVVCKEVGQVREVELVIEPTAPPGLWREEGVLEEYRRFLHEAVTLEQVWPDGLPEGKTMPKLLVSWEDIPAECWKDFKAKDVEKREKKDGKIRGLIGGMRRTSIASSVGSAGGNNRGEHEVVSTAWGTTTNG